MIVADAIGLSTFALIGAQKAYEANLGAFAIIFLATTTAVGGGLLRDITIREIPQILHHEFYASPAIILGACFAILRGYMPNQILIYILITITLALRLYAIYSKISLWRPWAEKRGQQ